MPASFSAGNGLINGGGDAGAPALGLLKNPAIGLVWQLQASVEEPFVCRELPFAHAGPHLKHDTCELPSWLNFVSVLLSIRINDFSRIFDTLAFNL